MRTLLRALLHGHPNRDRWSREQWFTHLLTNTHAPSERDDRHAIRSRD